jgi:hypothetical protein
VGISVCWITTTHHYYCQLPSVHRYRMSDLKPDVQIDVRTRGEESPEKALVGGCFGMGTSRHTFHAHSTVLMANSKYFNVSSS